MAKSDPKQPQKKLTTQEAIVRLREIQQGLSALVADLHSNIEALGEDPDFQDRMLDLQRDADERASILEREIKRLRGDVKMVRDLLDEDREEKTD
jgi:hypothetical protein